MGLYVETTGTTGPVVVCTHGVGDDSTTWSEVVVQLAGDGHRVTSWDLRGHGQSGEFDDYSRDAALSDLESIVRSTGQPAVLVGHSLGGYLSLALAITQPSLVRGLVLVATGPGYRNDEAREQWNQWLRDNFEPHKAQLGAQPDALVIDRLDEVKAPARLVVGTNDKRYHAGMEYLAKKLSTDVVMVDGARHHVQQSHPDVVAGLVRELTT
ncbi:MAG: alpha/beta fold hydrolase [Acidimicrobiia bacterium]